MIKTFASFQRVVSGLLCIIAVSFVALVIYTSKQSLEDHNRLNCVCSEANAKSALVYLEKPRRSYHGNHWYHIGEYFISRRKEIQSMIHKSNLSLVQLIAFDPHLSDMMTPFTFFMIMLTIQSSTLSSVELYRPLGKHQMKKLKRLMPRKSCSIDTKYGWLDSISGNNQNDSCSSSDHQAYQWAPFSFRSSSPMYSFATNLHPSSVSSEMFSLARRKYSTFETSAASSTPSQCHCGQYLGRVGNIPLNSTEWFTDYHEAVAIQHTASALCAGITSYHPHTEGDFSYSRYQSATIHPHDPHREVFNLVIYERDKNRKFSDLMRMLRDIDKAMDTSLWNIDIIYHTENISPCKLQKVMSTADVFLTSHGFQCIALMFMKRGSTLIEIFPYKYFKPTYIPLCSAFGIHHKHISNEEPSSPNSRVLQIRTTQQCMGDIMCRSFARHQNVMMPPDHIQLVVKTMRDVQSR